MFVLLHDLLPGLAENETRTVILTQATADLPADYYSFCEMFCDERGCDCRRVFFYVISTNRRSVEAVIAYGWESADFYARWMKQPDPASVVELQGPCLNFGSPASELAPALLRLFQSTLLPDAAYIDRVKRHYRLFRERIEGKRTVGGSTKRRKVRGKSRA